MLTQQIILTLTVLLYMLEWWYDQSNLIDHKQYNEVDQPYV